jgi:hypothetical protein
MRLEASMDSPQGVEGVDIMGEAIYGHYAHPMLDALIYEIQQGLEEDLPVDVVMTETGLRLVSQASSRRGDFIANSQAIVPDGFTNAGYLR